MDNKQLLIVESLILFMAFALSNLRALVFYSLFSRFPWAQIALWGGITLVVIFLLKRMNLIGKYWMSWRKNWPLALFICLAFVSISWSLALSVTLFRALELLLATLVASYLGMRLRPYQLSAALFWFGAIVLMLSMEFVFIFPGAGRMFQFPYGGAWRGIYWHKNHLGSIIALLNAVFLGRFLVAFEERRNEYLIYGLLYIFSIVVLYFSNSATGYILVIILHFFILCGWIWLK